MGFLKKKIFALSLFLFAAGFSDAGCAGNTFSDRVFYAFTGFDGEYAVIVNKKNFTLQVVTRDCRTVLSCPVAYGMNPDGKNKMYEGDNRTPEGLYHVNEILSMDADKKSPSYRKLKAMNDIYFSRASGHCKYGSESEDLGKDAYGPRYFGIDYPSPADMEEYNRNLKAGILTVNGRTMKPGYGIAIHGNNDPASIGHRSSSGCVRMYNRDVIEMDRYIFIGTPVLIVSE